MQINKPRKQPRRQSSNTLFDDDFTAGFEDSRLDKFKPALKVFAVIIFLMTTVWVVSAYFGETDTKNNANKDYTPNTTVEQAVDNSKTQDTEATSTSLDSPPSDNGTTSNGTTKQQSSSSSPTTTKSYDPSKCDGLNNEATRLRQVADQKKTTYDNAFAARKNYGDFYSEVRSEYGNNASMYEAVKAEADRRYNAQEAQLNTLQTDWQNALSAGNTAYSKYQECRASL